MAGAPNGQSQTANRVAAEIWGLAAVLPRRARWRRLVARSAAATLVTFAVRMLSSAQQPTDIVEVVRWAFRLTPVARNRYRNEVGVRQT
ncbi:MAG: hypothetical protein ACSLE6_15110 [Mycobacterium sp.]